MAILEGAEGEENRAKILMEEFIQEGWIQRWKNNGVEIRGMKKSNL